MRFQSPRTGKFESNEVLVCFMFLPTIQFQSPRSGKFESNARVSRARHRYPRRFNPLDRGNLNQIQTQIEQWETLIWIVSFNPLDRGNLNQIIFLFIVPTMSFWFQSPRSGKFESNSLKKRIKINNEFLKNYQEVPLYHIQLKSPRIQLNF